MSACAKCHTELDAIGCDRCKPAIDLDVLPRIVASPEWKRAPNHEVGSRRGTTLIGIGAMIGIGILLVGQGKGPAMWVIGGVMTSIFLIPGLVISFRRLHHEAAIVLGTAYGVSKDSDGVSMTYYSLHVQTAAGKQALTADLDQISALRPGEPVIVFTRGDFLDAVWPLALGEAVRAESPPSIPPGPPPVKAAAPASNDQVARGVTALASVSVEALERAMSSPIKRPSRGYFGAIMWAVWALVVFALPFLADVLGKAEPSSDPDREARGQVVAIVFFCIAAAMLALAGFLALRYRRRQVARTLAYVLDRRTVRQGDVLVTAIDLVFPDGTRAEWTGTSLLGQRPYMHEPVVVCRIEQNVIGLVGIR